MPRTPRSPVVAFAFPAVVLALSLTVALLPGCDPKGSEMDLDNITTYTSATFAEALQASVVSGRVNYPVIAKGYVAPLEKYVELFATRGPRTRRETLVFTLEHQKAAYYVNVHNALIVKCWLDHGAGSGDPDLELGPAWLDEKKYRVDGETVSINDVARLARGVTRPDDPSKLSYPLIALALNTGTVSGPPMPSPPFESEVFQRQFTNYVRGYFASRDAFTVSGDQVTAPAILEEISQTVSDFEFFLDTYIPETYDEKLAILQAARYGTIKFRPPSNKIHLPHDAVKPAPEPDAP